MNSATKLPRQKSVRERAIYKMPDKKSQDGNTPKKPYDSGQGGFMAVLHTLEKEFYGPGSPINIKGRVLLYIRHRALRDFQPTKQIPKSEIVLAVGAKKNKIEDALRDLEKEKHLLVTRTKVGKVWGDNIYELHPAKYGTDYIYRPEKPSFKVIYGSKGHKSNKKPDPKDIHKGGVSYPQTETPPSCEGVEVPSQKGVGVVPLKGVGKGSKSSESQTNSASKNPFQEPIKRTLSENNYDCNKTGPDTENGEATREAKEAIRKIVGMGLRSLN